MEAKGAQSEDTPQGSADCTQGDTPREATAPRPPIGEKIAAAVFLAAVSALALAAFVFFGHRGGTDGAGNASQSAQAARLPSAQAENLSDRLEFVGPDAPLTPLSPFRSIFAPENADAPMPLEKWANGTAKATSQEWSFEGHAIEEVCWFGEDGSAIGCGIFRDGERWEGVFAKWAVPAGKLTKEASVLRELVSYREGEKDGLARAWRFDGAPLLETFFERGVQVRKRVFRQQDNQVIDLGSKRLSGLPESHRSRNTQN